MHEYSAANVETSAVKADTTKELLFWVTSFNVNRTQRLLRG
jgi:hypothetical protein